MAFNYSSGSVPVPMGSSVAVIGGGTSGPFASSMSGATIPYLLNQLSAAENLNYALGAYGIISGLELTCPSGLNIEVQNGLFQTDGAIEIVTAGALAPRQINAPAAIALPASATSYVWLTGAGALIAGETDAPPAGAKLFLGIVTMGAATITGAPDYSGVTYLSSGIPTRHTNDSWAPTDAPGCVILTVTNGGTYLWDGVSHKQLVDPAKQFVTPYESVAMAADLVLAATSPNIICVSASVAGLFIHLPDPTKCTPGHNFTLMNVGASDSVGVKNSAGTTVLASLAVGEQTQAIPYLSGGALVFPSTLPTPTPFI